MTKQFHYTLSLINCFLFFYKTTSCLIQAKDSMKGMNMNGELLTL